MINHAMQRIRALEDRIERLEALIEAQAKNEEFVVGQKGPETVIPDSAPAAVQAKPKRKKRVRSGAGS